jgi:serine/threonine-protein kinase
MGEVWLATARGPGGFQKRVVIKTVLPDLVEKAGYVQMLVKEASLAARLDHPNIVHVFDLGCVGDLYYIAMEYLSGRSLAQMLRRSHEMGQRLTLRVLLTMIAIACDGLQYAHDQTDDEGRPLGLLHRDLSPSNIMLTFAGRVALLDFGVATAANSRYRTRSGTIKGKFHYLAPERVRGEPHDRRSDIYSLGVVLYQCLTLRWPFRAQGEYELLRQIANEAPPPLRHYAPWVPPRLEQIVMRAMAHQPTTRHQQAADLAAELREHIRAAGPAAEPGELAAYLAELFPEAPEAAARRQLAEAASRPPAEAVEILFHAGDPIELDELRGPGEPVELDQPDPAAMASGSPAAGSALPAIPTSSVSRAVDRALLDGPGIESPAFPPPQPSRLAGARLDRGWTQSSGSRPAPADPGVAPGAQPVIAPVPRPVVAPSVDAAPSPTPAHPPTPAAAEPRRRHAPTSLLPDDVDIFPEPTRTLAPLGRDVFSGYGGSRAPGRSSPARADDPDPWPWATSARRTEQPTREATPDRVATEETGPKGGR